jgi:hypothetical protein
MLCLTPQFYRDPVDSDATVIYNEMIITYESTVRVYACAAGIPIVHSNPLDQSEKALLRSVAMLAFQTWAPLQEGHSV